ncbi:ATP-binding protein [Leifsonia sp. McL0607]|uniref:ATP-binding protein n=1 Tax=Leifsonia sp. McL0607 TaxID=3415672 RepID=UPI003CF9982B
MVAELTIQRAGRGIAPLPSEYSTFIDRRKQLTAARELLGTTRLLTVVGPGGVGKTRFAIKLAKAVRNHFPGGEWYIDLTRVSPSGSLIDEMSGVLGVPTPFSGGVERIVSFFGSKRGLLVLDNCEHILDQCIALVHSLLAECPGLTVLATSREAMRVAAERLFLLDPFETEGSGSSDSAAAALFLERCAAVLPEPSDADRKAIAEICVRLDGLPLAIELAATRMRALAAGQILDMLTEPLPLLTGGPRDAPDRQRTMSAAIEWSYALCTPEEQLVWARMSVFVGGWELEALAWMYPEDAASALDIVQPLLDKSIVVRRQTGNLVYYDMLDTIRAFGSQKLSEAQAREARALHRDWYLDRIKALSVDWYGPRQAHWLAYLRRELPNFRAAIEFSLAEGDPTSAGLLVTTAVRPMWMANGLASELHRWLELVVGTGTPPTLGACVALGFYGNTMYFYGDRDEGLRMLARARDIAEQIGDPAIFAIEEMRTLNIHPYKLQVAETEKLLERYGTVYQIHTRTNTENRLAAAYDRAGDIDSATEFRERLIGKGIKAGDSYETMQLLFEASLSAVGRGEAEQATKLARQALSLALNLDSPPAIARCEEALARAAVEARDFVRAATLLGVSFPDGDPAGAIVNSDPRWGPVRAETETETKPALGQRAYDAAIAAGKSMTVEEGAAYALGTQLPDHVTKPHLAPAQPLSPRESQVAALVGQGLTDRQIAERLVISRRTAEGHVASGLMKLGFTSRSQLAAWTKRQS